MKLEPFGNYVVIRVKEIKSTSGIIITGSKVAPTEGEIVAINAGCAELYNLKIGDVINFGQHRCVKITTEGQDFHLIEIKEAYGVYRDV